ncbi:MAG: winged helix-turn-helix domain-containing protein [Caldilineales bacterium]
MHVLVVHSEPRFFRELKVLMAQHEVESAYLSSLNDLSLQLEAQYPDLIVLEQRCLAAGCRQLSMAFERAAKLPVVFLTSADSKRISAGEERQRLADLVMHLLSHGERVRSTQVIQIGQLRIHMARMRATLDDSWVKLSPIQFRMVRHLALNANTVVSYQELADAVWGADTSDNDAKRDLIKVHIVQVRRALGPAFKDYIQAVRGQGYVLVDPASEDETTLR